jgi:hypothetical protein
MSILNVGNPNTQGFIIKKEVTVMATMMYRISGGSEEDSFNAFQQRTEEMHNKSVSVDVMAKCLVIAFRVVKGDSVCPRDNTFLFDNCPKLHFSVWSGRTETENAAC